MENYGTEYRVEDLRYSTCSISDDLIYICAWQEVEEGLENYEYEWGTNPE